MTPFLVQAAATVVNQSANGPAPLTLGEWIAICLAAVSMGGVVYRTGVNSAETRHIKEDSESHWATIKETLDKIVAFVDESMRLRIQWADWRGQVTSEVAAVRALSEDARDVAHQGRAFAQSAVTNTDKLDERMKHLEREEERRSNQHGRRQGDT